MRPESRQPDRLSDSAPSIVARVLRGGRVESVHRGIAAVRDSHGGRLAALGNADASIFLRSAAKPFQALPLLEAGGERVFRLSEGEIALMCSSHGGEPRHVRVAERLLARGGFGKEDLGCGAAGPMHEGSARALARRGVAAGPLHNNCSGKHAGLLLACRLFGFPTRSYREPGHPIQKEIRAILERLCGIPAAEIETAVDGCSLPVYRFPLSALALGYARLLARELPGEGAASAAARRRVVAAMASRPDMVAGRGRFTTDFLRAGRGRWIGKEGAEGVYAVGIAATSGSAAAIGVALKIEDGSTRARDAVTLALLDRMGVVRGRARSELATYRRPVVRNARGDSVGAIEAEVSLSSAR